MKVFARMQAVRAKSVSPTSRGLRLPFPCSEIVDLTQDDEEKRKKKVVKEATRKKWVEKFPWIEWTGCMVLNQLHKKVSQIEIGRLEDGIDDGEPEFDFAFCADDGSDDDGDDGDDDALWLEDEEGSDEVEDESIFLLLIPTVWQLFKLKVKPHFWRTFDITNYQCNKILPPPPVPPP
jgi:hypothetical protein